MATGTIRNLSAQHAERLKAAFGNALSDAKAAACERTADLLALSENFRTRLVDAESGDIEKLLRLEAIADGAVAALCIPAMPAPQVTGLRVTFVDGFSRELGRAIASCAPGDDVGRTALTMARDRIAELEAENKSLTERVVDLERQLAQARAGGMPVIEGVSVSPADEQTHVRPIVGHHELLPPARALPKPKHSDVYAVLASINAPASAYGPGIAHGSEYQPPDRTDPQTGRRLP
jgi:hypothetical protein